MIYIKNTCTNPCFNLALEEYVLKNLDNNEEYVILWQNEPTVVIGRNQNAIEEINQSFVEEKGIHVVRRLSGGGAVYHDLGNLNFTFIVKSEKTSIHNFEKFTASVISLLRKLGINAEFTGRNDITIDGKKFSGNSQYYYKDRLLHHGTILFDSDLTVVQNALNVKVQKIESKGIKSVKSRVTNVSPYLKDKITIQQFKELLLTCIFEEHNSDLKEYILQANQLKEIEALKESRYAKWDWVYGESPESNLEKSIRFPFGLVEAKLNIKQGQIRNVKIYGDYFGEKDICELEKTLEGLTYEKTIVDKHLQTLPIEDYIAGAKYTDILEILF